ncbi:hypothetical protein [Streptomyces sp. NPDC056468]
MAYWFGLRYSYDRYMPIAATTLDLLREHASGRTCVLALRS